MTDILAWLNPGRWLMLLTACSALVLGYVVWQDHQQGIGEARANARWKIATDQIKADARTKLADETAKVRTAEQALQDFKHKQELKDAHNQTTVAGLAARIRVLAGPSGRLRDPNATGCRGGSDSAPGQVAAAPGDSANDRTETGGLLSEQLSGLLRARIEEADTINNAYIACRADIWAVRAVE